MPSIPQLLKQSLGPEHLPDLRNVLDLDPVLGVNKKPTMPSSADLRHLDTIRSIVLSRQRSERCLYLTIFCCTRGTQL